MAGLMAWLAAGPWILTPPQLLADPLNQDPPG